MAKARVKKAKAKAKAKPKAKAKAKPKAKAKAKAKAPTPTPPAKTFECTDLALCVIEAMVHQKLVTTDVVVPPLAPDDDDDLDDESESWRDRVVDNQTDPIERLVAELERSKDKLPRVTEITGVLIDVADEYEPEIWSLAGIEACTGLERIDLWTSDETLDLSPLTRLPKLVAVDLTCAGRLNDLRPLLAIPSLAKVTGTIDAATAEALRRRGVEVELK